MSLPDIRMRDESPLVAALRAGDELAFATLVDRYHGPMIRVARAYTSSREAAEDAVQEAWLGAICGLEAFEGRSSVKTWLFRIVMNRAMSRGERESRSVPFSSLSGKDIDAGTEPPIDPSGFRSNGRDAGWWAGPASPDDVPEDHLLSQETLRHVEHLIDALPTNQRVVITLRDVQGLSSHEVCDVLDISEANQRVLLHRARVRIRHGLERHLSASALV